MATYLLLRNNKETGPYTLNELVEFGMKPYDLVWVNGRSAAWRYPSEVNELKNFAPVLEEQPYDRFYKKPIAEEHYQLQSQSKVQIHKEEYSEVQEPREEIKYEMVPEIPKVKESIPQSTIEKKQKQVYISLPVNHKQQIQPVKEETKFESYQPKINQPQAAKILSDIDEDYGESEKVIRLEKRFSQPLDEIKDQYVQTLVDRKKKIAKKNFFMQNLKKASVFFLVLAMGVLIGFAFKNKSGKENFCRSPAFRTPKSLRNTS